MSVRADAAKGPEFWRAKISIKRKRLRPRCVLGANLKFESSWRHVQAPVAGCNVLRVTIRPATIRQNNSLYICSRFFGTCISRGFPWYTFRCCSHQNWSSSRSLFCLVFLLDVHLEKMFLPFILCLGLTDTMASAAITANPEWDNLRYHCLRPHFDRFL